MPPISETNAQVVAEFRANKGVVAAPYDDPPPMVLLHTIGRKSGTVHLVPMRAMELEYALYVFGSAHGSERHPDWYLNLLVTPDILVEKGSEIVLMRATNVVGDEHERIFSIQSDRFPIFAEYQSRLERTIPVVKLERLESKP